MAAVVDWNLYRTVAWETPIRALAPHPTAIGPELYRIADEVYALAFPDRSEGTLQGEPPFVSILYWAASDGAARRAAIRDVDSDDGAVSPPPAALWGEAGAPDYRSLRAYGRASRPGGILERASYRMDGRFIHGVLDLGATEYYFREPEIDDGAVPYAIALRCT